MPDFNTLDNQFRLEILADDSDDTMKPDDRLELLFAASVRIGSVLGIPQAIDTSVTLVDGNTTITLPTDATSIQISGITVGNLPLTPATRHVILRKRLKPKGMPEIYHFDPKIGGVIQIAPAFNGTIGLDGSVTIEYTKAIDPSTLDQTDSPWDGNFPEWHHLVPIEAGVTANQSLELYDRATYFRNESRLYFTSFGQYLGLPDDQVAKAFARLEARRDQAGAGAGE